jgi:membrane protease YdiL (CAAX protease family)
MAGPSFLLANQTKKRLLDLQDGIKAVVFLPLTVGVLLGYVIFVKDFVSQIPLLNLSWLGYNIALGPFGNQGLVGILPFVPFLVYMLIHVNYFEELYFRKNVKRVILWAFLHVAMGVAINVALVLLPLGFFYRYLFNKYGVNYAYALHFATNLVIVGISFISYFFSIPSGSSF